MRRIGQRLRAVEPKRAALFLAVAALAAVAMYFGGREASVGRPTEAGTTVAQEQSAEPAPQNSGEEPNSEAEVEPLTLTLSASEICEVHYPKGGWTHTLKRDDEGNWQNAVDEAWWDWDSVGTMEIAWEAAGGDGSYVVTIAGETYSGDRGTAAVSCAMEHGPIINHPEWGRIHADDDEPVVDSGLKTINASVSDGSGASATAAAEVYMVLNRGFGTGFYRDGGWVDKRFLRSGKTYRINGTLVTVPQGVDLRIDEIVQESPGEGYQGRCCTIAQIGVVGSNRILGLWLNEGDLPFGGSRARHPHGRLWVWRIGLGR